MPWTDNRAWGARTRFSDDPFVLEDALPQICDDLKWRALPCGASGARRTPPDPNHQQDQPIIHHPSKNSVASSAKGPAQRDRRWIAPSICSCGTCHQEAGFPSSRLFVCTGSCWGAAGAAFAPLPLSCGWGERSIMSAVPTIPDATCRQNSPAGRKGKQIQAFRFGKIIRVGSFNWTLG